MVKQVTDSRDNTILECAMQSVVSAFEISREDIMGKSRLRSVVYARHAFCSILVNVFNAKQVAERKHGIPFAVIGGFIGRDHSTVLYSAGTSHDNNMGGRNSDYIPFYYQAKKLFTEMTDEGDAGLTIRRAELDKELAHLRKEKQLLIERIKQQKQI